MSREFLLTRPIVVYATLLVALVGSLFGGAAVRVQAGSPRQASDEATLRVAMPAPDTLDPIRVSRFDRSARDLVHKLDQLQSPSASRKTWRASDLLPLGRFPGDQNARLPRRWPRLRASSTRGRA